MLVEEMPGYREWIDPPIGKSRCGWYEIKDGIYLVSLKRQGEMLRRIVKVDDLRLSIKIINDFVDYNRLPDLGEGR